MRVVLSLTRVRLNSDTSSTRMWDLYLLLFNE